MSGSVVTAVTNSFSFSEILPPGHRFWGILEAVEPVGEGLIRARVSGKESLVDESLLEILRPLVGQQVEICHAKGCWAAGRVPA